MNKTDHNHDIEVEIFLQASRLFHESYWIKLEKKAGHFSHLSEEDVEQWVSLHFNDAYQKIPSRWLKDLDVLLNQMQIRMQKE